MPEVAEQPKDYPLVENNPEPYNRGEIEFPKKGLSAIREHALSAKKALIKNRPDKQEIISSVYGLFYNVFLLEEGIENTSDAKQKVISASIQHNFVHYAYFASTDNASQEFAATVFKVASTTQWLIRETSFAKGIKRVLMYWSGIKSELAVVKTLKNFGLPVFLPDYAQPVFKEDGSANEQNEVYQFDVREAIDLFTFVETERGKIGVLVNVKGLMGAKPGVSEMNRKHVGPLARQFLDQNKARGFVAVQVIVPSGYLEPDRVFLNSSLPPKEKLKKLAELNPEEKFAIVKGITRLAQENTQ